MLAGPRRRGAPDSGASAVEFALLVPLLFLILLGVIQYGYGLFQVQNFTSLMSDASKIAGTGVSTCADFRTGVQNAATASGLQLTSPNDIHITWLSANPDPAHSGTFLPATSATRQGLARVTATFRPFRIGAPFVPFPQTITRTQTTLVTDTGLLGGAC